ncbi:hypothetical protein DICVIV_13227, partial [Dictyocaulus viviparus]
MNLHEYLDVIQKNSSVRSSYVNTDVHFIKGVLYLKYTTKIMRKNQMIKKQNCAYRNRVSRSSQ